MAAPGWVLVLVKFSMCYFRRKDSNDYYYLYCFIIVESGQLSNVQSAAAVHFCSDICYPATAAA